MDKTVSIFWFVSIEAVHTKAIENLGMFCPFAFNGVFRWRGIIDLLRVKSAPFVF